MKIIGYNVNGVRAAVSKGLLDWLRNENPDIVCFNEIKATIDQIDTSAFEELGYYNYWYPAVKKGYSGTGILCKKKPENVVYGCGIETYDNEGRVLRVDFKNHSVVCNYFPSGSNEERQAIKMNFLNDMLPYYLYLKKQIEGLIIVGDFNICHQAIDIHDPKGNKNSSGFLPEERAWMQEFFDAGFIDSYRMLHPEALHQYTWWSYRANARNNNKGWRIDYQAVAEGLKNKIIDAGIMPDAMHSDHCPTWLSLDM
jgi:exodeoxyribonuclease-3